MLATKTAPRTITQDTYNKDTNRRSEIHWGCFVAAHGLPLIISDYVNKSNLFALMFSDSQISQTLTINRKKTTFIIKKVLSPECENSCIQVMKEQPFCLIFDSTTDNTVKSQSCLLVQAYDYKRSKLFTFLYKLLETPNAQSLALYEQIELSLEKFYEYDSSCNR